MMVPRADFLTCSLSQSAAEVKARNEDNYSFLPVVDEGERVLGLYNAEQWFASEPQDEMVGVD
jgi:CBS domain containing-hemolysin-like protein